MPGLRCYLVGRRLTIVRLCLQESGLAQQIFMLRSPCTGRNRGGGGILHDFIYISCEFSHQFLRIGVYMQVPICFF